MILSSAKSYFRVITIGNLLVLRFFFQNLFRPFRHLPKELYDDTILPKKMAAEKTITTDTSTAKSAKSKNAHVPSTSFTIQVDKSYVDKYNRDLKRLQSRIRELGPAYETKSFVTKQYLFWILRLATVVLAWRWRQSPLIAFVISLVQFLILPYSFSIAIAYGIETVMWGYLHHIIVYPILTYVTEHFFVKRFIPESYQSYTYITVSTTFVVVFLIIDQLLCALALFWCSKGTVQRPTQSRIIQSIWYGFLNCKTYYLVLLPLCFGINFSILPVLLDTLFGLSSTISQHAMKYVNCLFYNVHRLGHLPNVYGDSHRFHHYLHDATAFDAHIFGSGATEEWLLLVTDALLVLVLGILPGCFNPNLLKMSWADKFDFHTRVESPNDQFDARNFHVDHHVHHHTNYGATYPLDMIMGTTPRAMNNICQNWMGYSIEKSIDLPNNSVQLVFTPNGREAASHQDQNHGCTKPQKTRL